MILGGVLFFTGETAIACPERNSEMPLHPQQPNPIADRSFFSAHRARPPLHSNISERRPRADTGSLATWSPKHLRTCRFAARRSRKAAEEVRKCPARRDACTRRSFSDATRRISSYRTNPSRREISAKWAQRPGLRPHSQDAVPRRRLCDSGKAGKARRFRLQRVLRETQIEQRVHRIQPRPSA